jgi:hypothetical protein
VPLVPPALPPTSLAAFFFFFSFFFLGCAAASTLASLFNGAGGVCSINGLRSWIGISAPLVSVVVGVAVGVSTEAAPADDGSPLAYVCSLVDISTSPHACDFLKILK